MGITVTIFDSLKYRLPLQDGVSYLDFRKWPKDILAEWDSILRSLNALPSYDGKSRIEALRRINEYIMKRDIDDYI